VHEDARPIWDGLTSGWGLVPLVISAAAGGVTLLFVSTGRYEAARYAGAAAVAAVVAGWAVAQSPYLLPGVTVDDAAAGHATLVALVIAVAVGVVVLFPSLALLFNLSLAGRFDPGRAVAADHAPRATRPPMPGRLAVAGGLLVVGAALTLAFDTTVGLGLGIACLLGFIVLAFGPLAADEQRGADRAAEVAELGDTDGGR